jgi:superoxide dismutase, Fe-Mn family
MSHELMKLPYSYEALEPYLDAKTVEIHHWKHHQNYVNNLNTALETLPEFQNLALEELLTKLDSLPQEKLNIVKNNAGGVYNHNLYWLSLAANSPKVPQGNVAKEIDKTFTNFENFKKLFSQAGVNKFGSGWVFLVVNKSNLLEIISTSNQDTPLAEGLKPILTLDVWEHAYYLKYQNRRVEYIENWWNLVNWAQVDNSYHNLR